MNYMNASRDIETFVRRTNMMESLTLIEEFDFEGTIWQLGDDSFIIQVNNCGEDMLYWTDDLAEARKKFVGEEEDEPLNFVLHEGDTLIDLMTKYETLSMPALRTLMERQGFYLDKSDMTIKKK